MKKFMKNGIVALVALGFMSTSVHAALGNFAGSANYYYNLVGTSLSKDDPYTSTMTWNTSDEGSHKMWFRVSGQYDTNNYGKILITNDGRGVKQSFNNSSIVSEGSKYRLYASRENISDPSTYVTGTWNP